MVYLDFKPFKEFIPMNNKLSLVFFKDYLKLERIGQTKLPFIKYGKFVDKHQNLFIFNSNIFISKRKIFMF